MKSQNYLKQLSKNWFLEACKKKYHYNFTWLGRPIIQFPQDVVAMQEIIWKVRPDLIIETGIAHGGSLVFSASMLEIIGKKGQVLGVDIDIRKKNRDAIKKHPLSKRIKMVEGSSLDPKTVEKVYSFAKNRHSILVALDSNHTLEHVKKELEFYSPLVTKGSYLVVFDTVIEHMPDSFFKDRPWHKGNGPLTAVHQFLKKNKRFKIDREMDAKLVVSSAPNGYLKCIRQ